MADNLPLNDIDLTMEDLYDAEWQGQSASHSVLPILYHHNRSHDHGQYSMTEGRMPEHYYIPVEKDVDDDEPARIINICQTYTHWCPVSIINMISSVYEIYDFI